MNFLQFWAARFVEHLSIVIPWVVDFCSLKLTADGQERLRRLTDEWTFVTENERHLGSGLLQRTVDVKAEVREMLKRKNWTCFPDLLDHMIEELTYVRKVLDGRLTKRQELRYWFLMHQPEVFEFTRCVIPVVLQDLDPTTDLTRTLNYLGELATEFRNLWSLMGPSAVDSNELKAVINRQKKTAVRLLRIVKQVGVSQSDVKMLKTMIDHEDKEFAFTLERIKLLQT
jgi:hypothetical protein